ncbi:hypothetical protein B0H19DRAFT_1276129 [Mycena capillaripes]|nr:hypothetical protein B0H19DRAFT_1276129 [Mycena capillaripes]
MARVGDVVSFDPIFTQIDEVSHLLVETDNSIEAASIPRSTLSMASIGAILNPGKLPPTVLHSSTDDSFLVALQAPSGTVPAIPQKELPVPAPEVKRPNQEQKVVVRSDDDSDDSDPEKERARLLGAKTRRAKETVPRAKKTSASERLDTLLEDPNTVKNQDGTLKGAPHIIFCQCTPNKPTGVKPGAKPKKLKTTTKPLTAGGFFSFFGTNKKTNLAPTLEEPAAFVIATATSTILADQRLFFRPSPQANDLSGCVASGLIRSNAVGYTVMDIVNMPTKWVIRPLENSSSEDSDSDGASEFIPEKAVREACQLTAAVELVFNGTPVKTNKSPERSRWTDYEKQRLHQSQLVAARWIVHANSGFVFAKGCHGTTTNWNGTCAACTAVGHLEGLKQGVRRARATTKLTPDEVSKRMAKRLVYIPLVRSDHEAAVAKASLANPCVLKILTSKAKYGPVGVFLSLYQQGLRGDLNDQETFVAISAQLLERVRRSQDPTGHSIHGMRYDPVFVKYCTLMRSYGPRSGAQYDLMSGMTGAISQHQMRRRVAKSATRMLSAELCPGNLFSALDFAKLMKYDGPWICAGDGTKLLPLLTVSCEFSGKDSGHVVGSTFPLSEVLFKTSQEKTKIISDIDDAKGIATQVWVLAIKIPLPGMPVFPVAFLPNHLKLRKLCGEAGMKLLASGADGAKSEVNAQLLMMNASNIPTRNTEFS